MNILHSSFLHVLQGREGGRRVREGGRRGREGGREGGRRGREEREGGEGGIMKVYMYRYIRVPGAGTHKHTLMSMDAQIHRYIGTSVLRHILHECL